MTLGIVALVCYAAGWGTLGYLLGRHMRARELDEHIDIALDLARSGTEKDTPLHRAQMAQFPDRSGWDQQ